MYNILIQNPVSYAGSWMAILLIKQKFEDNSLQFTKFPVKSQLKVSEVLCKQSCR